MGSLLRRSEAKGAMEATTVSEKMYFLSIKSAMEASVKSPYLDEMFASSHCAGLQKPLHGKASPHQHIVAGRGSPTCAMQSERARRRLQ